MIFYDLKVYHNIIQLNQLFFKDCHWGSAASSLKFERLQDTYKSNRHSFYGVEKAVCISLVWVHGYLVKSPLLSPWCWIERVDPWRTFMDCSIRGSGKYYEWNSWIQGTLHARRTSLSSTIPSSSWTYKSPTFHEKIQPFDKSNKENSWKNCVIFSHQLFNNLLLKRRGPIYLFAGTFNIEGCCSKVPSQHLSRLQNSTVICNSLQKPWSPRYQN